MPFRHKISIAFSIVLLLTIVVAMASWSGMQQALSSQNEVFAFQNHIERTFNAMRNQEHAFSTEEAITHSNQVFEHIAKMQSQISQLRTDREIDENRQLATLRRMLKEYEKIFASYVQHHLQMQTIRTRMHREANRLESRVTDFHTDSTWAYLLEQQTTTALLRQKDYTLTASPKNRELFKQSIENLRHHVQNFQAANYNDNEKLQVYRIGQSTAAYAAVFEQFANQQATTLKTQYNLREAFFQLSEAFQQVISLRNNKVNRDITFLQELTVATVILAVLLSIGATLLLSKFITRPIDLLKQSAMRIVDGDLNSTVTINSQDEIGELGKLFNIMTRRLNANFQELEQYRAGLEELVKERTRELELEIIERRQTEQQLAASEERFRTIFNNANDGILIADTSTARPILANRTLCTMLGYPEHKLLSLNISDIHPPQEREWVQAQFYKCTENTLPFLREISLLRHDGTIFPAEVTTTNIIINGEQYLLCNFRDISERKAMEEERLKARKLESVGILAGGIAHDFNNILSAILGNVSLTLALTDPQDKRTPLLSELERASLRARDLTQQLLTFSKGGEPVKELTSVKEIIKDSARFILRGSNVRCDFEFPDELWAAEVDAGQISQVIQNIVVNSRHAMPEGGIISIRCRNRPPSDQQPDSPTGQNSLEITITDSGPGISKEICERIFDPYFTTKKGGSGLGLAITHSIIHKHRGTISVDCPEGGGTTFKILLPAAPAACPLKDSRGPLPVSSISGTVLVMDDEAPLREISKQLLNHLGYQAITVSDGRHAVSTYREMFHEGHPPLLVIMDLTIPGGMGGREAAREILAIDPDARLIVSSGYSQDPIMANHHEFGFQGCLSKPYQLHELQALLNQLTSHQI